MQEHSYSGSSNIVYCTDKVDTKIDLYYTVNMAVMIYQFEDKISKQENDRYNFV